MKLTVFGATGDTGKHVVEQAVRAGHEVTAVVRDPARLPPEQRDRIEVVTAAVSDPVAITPAVSGRDAVISALGPGGRGPSTVCRDFARGATEAMRGADVRRLVVVSNSGNYTYGDGLLVKALVKPLLRWILREAYADMDAMEHAVRASGLDWTIVRPPRLTDKPATGSVRSDRDGNVRGAFRISRADLAGFLLATAADDTLTGRTVSVAGG